MTTKASSPADQQYITDFDTQAEVAIAGAATSGAVNSNEFVFAANFDGTGNTETNTPPANNQTTNVQQLYAEMKGVKQTNVVTKYYAGVGTPGMAFGSSFIPTQVTKQIVGTAQTAYDDFVREASSWLQIPGNQGKSVTAVVTAFSRGNGSAAVFSQMLFEKGLITPGPNGTILAPPGKVGISAGVLLDPVTTGTDGNMAFAPNAANLVQIAAENEYRSSFERTDYSADTGVTSITMMGNHCGEGVMTTVSLT